MKKIIKWVILVGLSFAILAASAWAVFILKEPFLRHVMVEWFQSLFVSTTPNWKTYYSPDGGLSLDSPFPITWEKKENIGNEKGFVITHGRSQLNGSGFLISTSYTHFVNLNRSLTDSIAAKKRSFQDETMFQKFQWEDQAVTCSGLPASLAIYSVEISGKPFHFYSLMVTGKNKSVYVDTSYYQKNLDLFNEWSKRVTESVKIEVKD